MINNELKNLIKKLILKEAYVDKFGRLRNFDFFPYDSPNLKYQGKSDSSIVLDTGDKSPFYDPELPIRNRMKTPDGGTYLKLVLDKQYQKKAFRTALNIALKKGVKTQFGNYKLPNFKFRSYGQTEVYEFNIKFSNMIKSIFDDLGKSNPIDKEIYDELKQMIH
jgi:hypothetical protein